MPLGLLALAIVSIGAVVGMAKLFADERLDRTRGDVAREPDSRPPRPPEFATSDYDQARYPRLSGRPLVGVNYTHYAFPHCTFHRTYIIARYHRPGVAETVHEQLMQMRENGITTLRTILWHDEDGEDWGPIPSEGGRLREPFRSNLIRYATEVRKFGFARLTIAFIPKGSHDPLKLTYEPEKFEENWRLIRTVRSLVKRHGPRDTRFDLFSEGAPNETPTRYEPRPRQTARYIARLYRRYVRNFGNRDVSVSVIASIEPTQPTNRMRNLIRILRSSGEALPRWYDVHIGFEPRSAAYALRHTEAALDAARQSQPLVIGDLGYDNPEIAKAIKRWRRRSQRRLEEVSPWYTRTHLGCQVTPPYDPGAYRELRPSAG